VGLCVLCVRLFLGGEVGFKQQKISMFSVCFFLCVLCGEIYFSLLNILSAGQFISLCLQYLQAREPRTSPLPVETNKNNKIISESNNQLKSIINLTIPIISGIIATSISGIRSFQVKFPVKPSLLPFLKNREHNLPLPKAHLFP
jgi:hypothetical protein